MPTNPTIEEEVERLARHICSMWVPERAWEKAQTHISKILRPLVEDKLRLDWMQENLIGGALINDDEGCWIVGGDGMQAIRSTQEPDEDWYTTYIFPGDAEFKPTARTAVDAARAARGDDEST